MATVVNGTDTYREFLPPAALRGTVACLWARRGDGAPVRVLPDTCSDIVWCPGAAPIVAGPDTSAWLSPTRPGELMVGARMLPGAGGAVLGVPLSLLRNQRIAGSELALGRPPEGEPPLVALIAFVERLLARSGDGPDRAVQAAAVRLLDPATRVDSLATELGFSDRQLRRRFLSAVGYGPKMLQRVLRLRRFLAEADLDLAAAAADAGYADQPHLSRECRALTGLSPSELRQDRSGHSAPSAAAPCSICSRVSSIRRSATIASSASATVGAHTRRTTAGWPWASDSSVQSSAT